MAELLLRNYSTTHADPVKDRIGCYKKGDIVSIQDDGYTWGGDQCLPKFLVVKIPGTKESLKYLMEPVLSTVPDADGRYSAITRRKYCYDALVKLGQAKLDAIASVNWQIEPVLLTDVTEKAV